MGLADRLPSQLRNADTIGRLGGDEFAVIVPRTCHADLVELASRLDASWRRPTTPTATP